MNDDEDEWGPWIVHDGKGCPCVGMLVQCVSVVNRLGEIHERTFVAKGLVGGSWFWAVTRTPPNIITHIIRYRIRKPKGMKILEGLLENLPNNVDDLVKESTE